MRSDSFLFYQTSLNGGNMKKIMVLKNTIQEYAWGSYSAIPELLGNEKNSKPQAELWMGAHPKAPSLVEVDDNWISLAELIKIYPEEILGKKTAEAFNYRLPYLFKVLAAAKPLSLQAHPNLKQAKDGFEYENKQNILLDAGNRNYKDDNHKPECICALTDYWALNGFRNISEILLFFEKIDPNGLNSLIENFGKSMNPNGLKHFFNSLMTLDEGIKQAAIDDTIKKINAISTDSPEFSWVKKLHKVYPHDIGIFAPFLFNLVCLKPGQAMYLPAGELHAYLDGLGIELMANSDNVLRGGLTPKHIDVPELKKILNFVERKIEILEPVKTSNCEMIYPSQAKEFVLSVIQVKTESTYKSPREKSVEIILCTQGYSEITDNHLNEKIPFPKGVSVIIPACVKDYSISGNAIMYKAAVPIIPG